MSAANERCQKLINTRNGTFFDGTHRVSEEKEIFKICVDTHRKC